MQVDDTTARNREFKAVVSLKGGTFVPSFLFNYTMDKITRLALGLSYPQDKISALLEIISATPNPVMATEILLGVYEKPKLPRKVRYRTDEVRIAKEFNDWPQTVTYKYLKPKQIGAYYPKGTDKTKLNDRNYKNLQCSSSENAEYLYFTSEEMEERTATCSYEDWLNCENITPERQFEDMYS